MKKILCSTIIVLTIFSCKKNTNSTNTNNTNSNNTNNTNSTTCYLTKLKISSEDIMFSFTYNDSNRVSSYSVTDISGNSISGEFSIFTNGNINYDLSGRPISFISKVNSDKVYIDYFDLQSKANLIFSNNLGFDTLTVELNSKKEWIKLTPKKSVLTQNDSIRILQLDYDQNGNLLKYSGFTTDYINSAVVIVKDSLEFVQFDNLNGANASIYQLMTIIANVPDYLANCSLTNNWTRRKKNGVYNDVSYQYNQNDYPLKMIVKGQNYIEYEYLCK